MNHESSPNISLPPELLHSIFEHLLDSPSSLLSCVLVGRYWQRVAERLLWSRLTLVTRSQAQFERMLVSVSEVCSNSRTACAWVRELDIGRGTHRLEQLFPLLTQLPSLERLSLSHMSFINRSSSLVPLLNSLLLSSPIHHLQLEDVAFQNPNLFRSLFSCPPNRTCRLTNLILSHVRFLRITDHEHSASTAWTQTSPSENNGAFCLRYLAVTGGMAPRLISTLHFCNQVNLCNLGALKYMDDWDEPHDLSALASLLSHCSSTLRSLTLFSPSGAPVGLC